MISTYMTGLEKLELVTDYRGRWTDSYDFDSDFWDPMLVVLRGGVDGVDIVIKVEHGIRYGKEPIMMYRCGNMWDAVRCLQKPPDRERTSPQAALCSMVGLP